ncbi:hypothetical protein JHK82_034523 [Glycine max]|uniref:Uncharacterized protein n=1 Tax=Glycine max TaxID=3847 RepID=K7LW48_SOYBN|nr:hypothetical protein JHK85_035239 [Glycine max]KAG4986902.1 hypothetical protein JHK86_034593 [Glycine max]KAG5120103.1 hypothetical protein JHK82_034523 [Glycine max]KAH1144168.1 hypothetical protein GYH30_034413 [Glycine max]
MLFLSLEILSFEFSLTCNNHNNNGDETEQIMESKSGPILCPHYSTNPSPSPLSKKLKHPIF